MAPASGRDETAKTHPCLVRYAILNEQEKEKDRRAVRHYADIVALSGHKIVEAGCATKTPAQRSGLPS